MRIPVCNYVALHEGLKKHKCEECGKSFSQDIGLKNHIESVHEGLKKYQCNFCDKPLSSK